MRPIRRRLAIVIGIWLFCQMSALMGGPVAMCFGMAADVPGQQCTCAHDAGQQACPMHHPAAPKSKTCSCRSTTDTEALAIASLLGPIAVLPSAIAAVVLPMAADSLMREGLPTPWGWAVPYGRSRHSRSSRGWMLHSE